MYSLFSIYSKDYVMEFLFSLFLSVSQYNNGVGHVHVCVCVCLLCIHNVCGYFVSKYDHVLVSKIYVREQV